MYSTPYFFGYLPEYATVPGTTRIAGDSTVATTLADSWEKPYGTEMYVRGFVVDFY